MGIVKGIISGYFNPLHAGHIEYIQGARLLCDYLIVIVNNDNQVSLKGSVPFMDEKHRALILENIRGVNQVVIASDKDKTVCQSIRDIVRQMEKSESAGTLIFFNSGDRQVGNLEPAESKVCEELGIKEVVLILPKRYSSSELIRKASLEV